VPKSAFDPSLSASYINSCSIDNGQPDQEILIKASLLFCGTFAATASALHDSSGGDYWQLPSRTCRRPIRTASEHL